MTTIHQGVIFFFCPAKRDSDKHPPQSVRGQEWPQQATYTSCLRSGFQHQVLHRSFLRNMEITNSM